MEQVKYTTKTITETTHYFYCDDCGHLLGSTTEDFDGYYPTLGNLVLQCHTPHGWYKLHKCLCDDCQSKFLDHVYDAIKVLGFEKSHSIPILP